MALLLCACHETDTIKPVTANLIYEETFEGDAPFSTAYHKEVGDSDYALQIVDAPVYKGIKSARFEVRVDQPLIADGIRSEVSIVRGALGQIPKDVWYSFSVFFPSDGFTYDPTLDVINQWYQDGSSTRLIVKGDKILLEVGSTFENKTTLELGLANRNKWHEFVFHFVHSHNDDGLVETWLGGKKVATYKGGNLYTDTLPKWKIGIYKHAFELGTSIETKRVVYFDNIRVGSSLATYRNMKPSNK
jgi:hypothetical protein